uniref:Cytochrome P450 n=1 Tax=Clastoptera arizonana TaxID=38151 RepID=A0A1B6DT56_9HEMI
MFVLNLLLEMLIGILLISYLIFKYFTRNNDYWRNKGVFYIKPKSLFSIISKQNEIPLSRNLSKLYTEFPNEKYVGTISSTVPVLIVKDTELIKSILIKDFSHFVDRGFIVSLPHDFLVRHLVHMEGDEWRRMRSKLSPTFTSGKMKLYFILIEKISDQLMTHLRPLAEDHATVDVKDLISRFTLDVISTCAFGLQVNSIEDPDNQVRTMAKLMFSDRSKDFLIGGILPMMPFLAKIFPITLSNPKVSQFVLKLVEDTVGYRKKNNVTRGDFIDLLMKLKTLEPDKEDTYKDTQKDTDKNDGELTMKEMAGQVSVFLAAGFETAASTTSFLLYELSSNKDIQDKLRQEIDTVIQKNGGVFSYQCLQEMSYLEKCIQETLRRYASLPTLSRKCVKKYQIPGTDVVIDEGVKVLIPIREIHHDPLFYPDPYKFNPERFSPEEVASRTGFTYLPFGEGPRICIGKRMGIMQVQTAVVNLLREFQLTLAPGMPTVLPINPFYPLTASTIPIQLVVSKRN